MVEVKRSESEFWDAKAERADDVVFYWDVITTEDWKLYNTTKFAVGLMGDIRGKRVLECGCGFGGLSCFLGEMGADVVAVDVSAKSLLIGMERAKKKGLIDRVVFKQMDCNALDLSGQVFDLISGSFILHHIEDLNDFARRLKGTLKDGGKGIFIENSGDNCLLMFVRKYILPLFKLRKGSESEHPLTAEEIRVFEQAFSEVRIHYPELIFFRLIASYFFNDWRPARKFLENIDTFCHRHLKFMRKYSYFRVIELTK